jgi:hypothetical protein
MSAQAGASQTMDFSGVQDAGEAGVSDATPLDPRPEILEANAQPDVQPNQQADAEKSALSPTNAEQAPAASAAPVVDSDAQLPAPVVEAPPSNEEVRHTEATVHQPEPLEAQPVITEQVLPVEQNHREVAAEIVIPAVAAEVPPRRAAEAPPSEMKVERHEPALGPMDSSFELHVDQGTRPAAVQEIMPATAPAPAVVAAPAPVTPLQAWHVTRDDRSLKSLLTKWSEIAGWQVSWELPVDYPLIGTKKYEAGFQEAVEAVVTSMTATEFPFKVIFYKGNSVVRVVGKGDR